MVNKTGAPLFAVGEKVEADPFLRVQNQPRGIVLRLFQCRSLQTKYRSAAVVLCQPTRPGETADGGGGDGWKLHEASVRVTSVYTDAVHERQPFHPKRSVVACGAKNQEGDFLWG